ncbi:DUF72 domain-containing protein [Pedobacter yulinensis]|uniref:DUF72 domain-containing protein n=1 Tax=Pedobacter yulinensis TaxID=2126353 RepID=A0A2T3HME1_9SPHI|nr:DUF72 domain-containing protein [Pedobacter yulinensis]PST83610.1 DUF72 domain-containing protein [Pedobacter yulinensis]
MLTHRSGYYTGTSGLLLPVRNKSFYPPEFQERSRLTYYGHLFNSLEVNSCFYKVPRAQTLQKWAGEVPEHFRFTFKLWKGLTHNKGLEFDEADLVTFMQAINAVGDKKGCLLVQFPGSFRPAWMHRLDHLLQLIRQNDPAGEWHTTIEFRHADWYRPATYELLEKHQMGLVLHDKLKQGILLGSLQPGNAVYLRFHGPGGDYRGTYPDDELYEYASYINDWLDEGRTVYTYFNNTIGSAIDNLQTLRKAVSGG